MRKLLLIALACLPIALVGCSDSHEEVVTDVLEAHRKMNDILESVPDRRTPEEAAEDLQEVVTNLERVKRRASELGPPAPEVDAELKEKYAAEVQAEQQRTAKIMQELKESDPTLYAQVNAQVAKLDRGETPSE